MTRTIQFTYLKNIIHWFLVCLQSCVAITTLILEHFYHSKINPLLTKMVLRLISSVYLCVCRGGFIHTSNSPDTSWVFCNSTQFWHYLPRDVTCWEFGPTKLSHPPFQIPITSPGCYLWFWLIGYKSEVRLFGFN